MPQQNGSATLPAEGLGDSKRSVTHNLSPRSRTFSPDLSKSNTRVGWCCRLKWLPPSATMRLGVPAVLVFAWHLQANRDCDVDSSLSPVDFLVFAIFRQLYLQVVVVVVERLIFLL
ncbi:unnamed protein product [Schistocephalus solidus]|uniref:Uncharacterized protein n=1 Tax=Schistocephalus solidus TaxID=70667 RepID=A0A183TL53_SCHSO|nr:unnamed protein product [Schistocephalus solidus]